MNDSLQNLLLYIPLHQLTFLTPMPKEHIYYENISEYIPEQFQDAPTLLILQNNNEYSKLNDINIVNLLIQDPKLAGVVICKQNKISIQEELLTLFTECQLPIIQIGDFSCLKLFHQSTDKLLYSYGQVSKELVGFMEKGFQTVANELAAAFGTPLLYFDENYQLLWQTGKEEEIRDAKRWINANRKKLVNGIYSNELSEISSSEEKKLNSYELFSINIAGMFTQTLLINANLAIWQKQIVDKLVGLMALLLQTEEMFQETQDKLKEHYVYDLLYHKYESQKEMIKQGKIWGWNLEKPHHLLILNVELSYELLPNIDWMYEIVQYIEMFTSKIEETLIVFPFQDQIVILLQDDEHRTLGDRKNYVIKIANLLEKDLSEKWPHYQFLIGISKWYEDTTNLNKEFQEAKLALQFGREWFENNIFYLPSLGVLRLLLHVHQEILHDYCDEYLSLLLESDDQNGTNYIQTLKVYIQHQGRITEISEALHVHQNTLRNRLKRIEEITGINLQNTHDFINLVIAVKILSFLKL